MRARYATLVVGSAWTRGATRDSTGAIRAGQRDGDLSDPGRIVQRDLDIQEYTDPDNDPMIPHTLVLKPGLVIHSIYNLSRR